MLFVYLILHLLIKDWVCWLRILFCWLRIEAYFLFLSKVKHLQIHCLIFEEGEGVITNKEEGADELVEEDGEEKAEEVVPGSTSCENC